MEGWMAINKDDLEALERRRLSGWMVAQVRDELKDIFSSGIKVTVENQETKLLKEIAENTRGLKGRVDKLIKLLEEKT